jgi:hypothetical protein
MAQYNLRFFGRKIGAIGLPYNHDVVVQAANPVAAAAKAYDTHEHLSGSVFVRRTDCDVCRAESTGSSDYRCAQCAVDVTLAEIGDQLRSKP